MVKDIESVTIFDKDYKTTIKEAYEKLFYQVSRNDSSFVLMPTVKVSKLRASILMPMMNINVKSKESGDGSIVEYEAYTTPIFKIPATILLLLFFVIGLLVLVKAVPASDIQEIITGVLLVASPFIVFYISFWMPYHSMLKALKWVTVTDMDKQREKEQKIDEMLKVYDKQAGIDEKTGMIN